MTPAEKKARLREVRARLAELRKELQAARALKKQRIRDLLKMIRAERATLRDRLREARRAKLAELRAWEQAERVSARAEWRRRKEEAVAAANGELARARAALAAERGHAAEVRRIARESRQRLAEHARDVQSDEDVRALVPARLVPLFERLKASIRGTPKESRAEAFLKLAAERTDEVLAVVEPRVEKMIEETIALLEKGKRIEQAYVRLPAQREAPANGNSRPSVGPAPTQKTVVAPAARVVKGEGLDTTGIAKRIREDIKAAVKKGELPKATYSVRTDKYSMGSSITVVVSKLPFPVLNPDAYRVDPGASWATFDSTKHRSRFTERAQAVERKLNAIVDAYHWDKSDSSTDYYNERFARDVRLTEDAAEWKKIEAAKVAAVRAADERV